MPLRNDHFSDRAARYASCRPRYPAELVAFLASVAAHDVAWDVGCGSGQMSVLLADHFARVVACDGSVEQLRHARPRASVHYVAAIAEAAPLAPVSVDMVVAAQSAHWFDIDRFALEVRRVARQGAVVALIAYGNARLDDHRLNDRFVRFYDEEIGDCWPAERRLIVDGYRTMPFPFDELTAPTFELGEKWTADQMLGYIETWSAVHVFERRGGDPNVLLDFARDLRELWGPGRRSVRWPVPLRVGRVG